MSNNLPSMIPGEQEFLLSHHSLKSHVFLLLQSQLSAPWNQKARAYGNLGEENSSHSCDDCDGEGGRKCGGERIQFILKYGCSRYVFISFVPHIDAQGQTQKLSSDILLLRKQRRALIIITKVYSWPNSSAIPEQVP